MADTTNLLTLETPILPVLTQRRSPRAYALDRPVSPEALRQVFAAASSAASCFGEQPWRYLVGSRASSSAAYEKILGSLAEFNPAWARNAPVLAVSFAKLQFSHDDNPNAWARHDVGQATATLAIQATELGLQIHQMAGFAADKVREAFAIPAGYEPVAVFTLGYPGDPGDPATLSDGLRDKETAPRVRKPLAEFMFEGGWPAPEGERYDQAPV